VKVKVPLYHTLEAADGQSRCIAVSLLILGARWWLVNDDTPRYFTSRMEKLLNEHEVRWV